MKTKGLGMKAKGLGMKAKGLGIKATRLGRMKKVGNESEKDWKVSGEVRNGGRE